MADIFLSYSRDDHDRVAPVVAALEARGWTVWWDMDVHGGDPWSDVIEAELTNARCVIVAWSKLSAKGDWVREEARIANKAHKLVPILLEPVDPPFGFGGVQAVDFSAWRGNDQAPEFLALCTAVALKLGAQPPSPPPPARKPVSPRRWLMVAIAVSIVAIVIALALWSSSRRPVPIPVPPSVPTPIPSPSTPTPAPKPSQSAPTLAPAFPDDPSHQLWAAPTPAPARPDDPSHRLVERPTRTPTPARPEPDAAAWGRSPPDQAYCFQRKDYPVREGKFLVRCFMTYDRCTNFLAHDFGHKTACILSTGLSGFWNDAHKDELNPPTWHQYSDSEFSAPFPQF